MFVVYTVWKSISTLILCAHHVELITRLSDGCSLVLVEAGALPVLYDVINNTNRNRASLWLVETTLQILLNLTKVSVCCLCEYASSMSAVVFVR